MDVEWMVSQVTIRPSVLIPKLRWLWLIWDILWDNAVKVCSVVVSATPSRASEKKMLREEEDDVKWKKEVTVWNDPFSG